jgi:PAS domain S-box-containing protein
MCPTLLGPGGLHGDGVCVELARSIDWSKTPLGPLESWSPILRTTANLVFGSHHPMLLFWGAEHVQLYNDAFLPSLREGRHPAAMGQRGEDCWPEVWSTIAPQLEGVMREGKPSSHEDHRLPIYRGGRLVETFWSYFYGPVFEADGTVGGTLVVCSEGTARVIAERRARTLRTLRAKAAEATTTAELMPIAVEVSRDALSDIPFAAAYEVRADGSYVLCRTTLIGHHETLLRLGEAVAAHVATCHDDTSGRPPSSTIEIDPVEVPAAPWPEPVTRVFIAKIPAASGRTDEVSEALEWTKTRRARSRRRDSSEVLVFGLSPRLPFDAEYQGHLEQLAESITQVRGRVEATEARIKAERQRQDLLRQTPIAAVLSTGPEQRIELANQAFIEILGHDPSGKTFAEAFPELVGSDIHRALDRVYAEGATFRTDELRLTYRKEGVPVERWFIFAAQPMRDQAGKVYGMIGTGVDITETIEARQAIERSSMERDKLLAAAEAASRAKDEFLAMLGHELRNPLAPITTALHLMKLKEPNALVREREIVARQAAHLVKLVDDLLDVARVARGKVSLNRGRISLNDVIARAVETASPLFEQKQHVLSIEVPSQGLDVHGDSLRLGQVFANLLTNAAKYTHSGGRIVARAAREGDTIITSIEDNGVGIPPDQLPHLFDAFFQGPRSPDRAEGGLGLGLALVKSFVALHGGTVAARSKVGGGSVFEVRLPALPLAEPEIEVQVESARATTLPFEGKRVLLVDDSDDILEIVASFLRYAGYEVLALHDAPSALRVAPTFCPNVAVLDIGLPAMDGYDLAHHLRELLGERTPRLIAMTGYGQDADRERARLAGFAAHLVKPVDPQELLASVRGTDAAAR